MTNTTYNFFLDVLSLNMQCYSCHSWNI